MASSPKAARGRTRQLSTNEPRATRKAPTRAAYHHGDLRNALLEAATRAVASHGIDALSLRALAQELGVFHRAAYRHFADRDDLLAAMLASAYQRLAATIAHRCRAPEPRARLRQAALAYAEFAFREPQMFFALSGQRVNEHGLYPELEAALQAASQPVVSAIERAIAAGVFPEQEPQRAALFFWASLQGVIAQILHRRFKVRASLREQVIEETAERLLAGLANPGR